MKKLDKTIKLLLLSLFFITPFLTVMSIQLPGFSLGNVSVISLVKEVIMSLIIFLIFISMMLNKKNKIDKFSCLIICYIIYGVLHICISTVKFKYGIDKFRLVYMYPITFISIYLYILNNRQSDLINEYVKGIKKIFNFQLIIILFFSLLEIVMGDNLRKIIYKGNFDKLHINLLGEQGLRIVSIIGNPINLSIILSLGIAFLLFAKKGVFRYFIISLSISIVLLSFSRTSYLIILIIFLMYIVFNRKSIRKIIFVVTIPIILSIYFFTNNTMTDKVSLVIKRVNTINVDTLNNNIRIDNWKLYIENTVANNPLNFLWGSGLGSSNSDSSQKVDNVYIVENSYVSILGEQGVIGLTMYIAIIILTIIRLLRLRKIKNQYTILLVILLSILFGSLFNDLYVNNPFSQYFWIIVLIVNIKIKINIYEQSKEKRLRINLN